MTIFGVEISLEWFVSFIYITYIIALGIILVGGVSIRLIKNKILKILTIIIILLFGAIILSNIKSENPDNLYVKMKEINDNQNLIGLSKEQIVELLGEPIEEYRNGKTYWYNAGKIYVGLIFGDYNVWTDYNWYILSIRFDENDIVKSTEMERGT